MLSATGCHAAFAELYDRTSAKVYGITLQLLRHPDLAADITREVFVDVWFQASRFDPGRGTPLGWIGTMAHRRAVDRVRSISRGRARDEVWAASLPQVTGSEEAWDRLESRIDADYIHAALRSLSPVQRDILHLTYLRGYSAAEAAQQLGVPLGTVKTRMRDGLIRLRRQLTDHPCSPPI